MILEAGSKLGPYEIVAAIGAGGMGEVYRARDPRVGREIAIKVSAEKFSERFEREARAVGALNHPNICTLYDVGPDYIVMELVEGETLADRIRQGAIPLDEALGIAQQIADAIEAAHEKGIIHRDLKPGNIKIRPDCTVKVLDFGLAKVAETQDLSLSNSPTLSVAATQQGVILGTAGYMSPEQARGKPVDKRADIWAFGVVLYEMLTGKRLFEGEDIAETLASVINRQPDLSPVPDQCRRLVSACLRKDPKRRLADIADSRLLLEEEPAQYSMRNEKPRRWRWLAGAVAAVLLCAALVVGLLWLRPKSSAASQVRFALPLPAGAKYSTGNCVPYQAISPDGRRIVFVATTAGAEKPTLWVRSLDSLEAVQLRGTEGTEPEPQLPFWSPDSRFVGFFAEGKVKKMDASGGPPQILCEMMASGGAWNRDGIILLGNPSGSLFRVSSAGGRPIPAMALDAAREELYQQWPSFLPDGRHFLFIAGPPPRVYVGTLDSNERKELNIATESKAAYAPPGYLLFARQNTLMAQPFDAAKIELTGEAFPIVENVRALPSRLNAAFSISENEILTYRSGSSLLNFDLLWFDRSGKRLGSVGNPGQYGGIALSPDEKRLAVHRSQNDVRDIWLMELSRGDSPSRFTFNSAQTNATSPVWSPDGSQVAFAVGKGIYRKLSNGAGGDELLLKSSTATFPSSWSHDGRFLLYHAIDPKTQADLWVLPMVGERKPVPFLQTAFNEMWGQFSPDGRWVAYTSDESGAWEIYVQSFPQSAGKWKVSVNGGSYPRWRRDGKEVFFLSPDRKLWSVDVKAGASTFEPGIPKQLFEAEFAFASSTPDIDYRYDVSADGQRFLIDSLPGNLAGAASEPMTVVLNWAAPFKK